MNRFLVNVYTSIILMSFIAWLFGFMRVYTLFNKLFIVIG